MLYDFIDKKSQFKEREVKMFLQDLNRTKIYVDKIKTKIPHYTYSCPNDLPDFTNKMGIQMRRYPDGLMLQLSGKIFATPTTLGAISIENVNRLSNVIENKTGVNIDLDYLLNRAPIYVLHLKLDTYTDEEHVEHYISDIREVIKAKTNKYDVYRYDDVIYEKGLQVLSKPSSLAIVPKAKKNERFAIYVKGAEIRTSDDIEYRQQLDHKFLAQTERILRFELQLRNFEDIRKICSIRTEDAPCLIDILNSDRNPVYKKFCELIDDEMEVSNEN